MDAGFDAHLRADGVAFDADDAALLSAVAESGSLNRAAESLGRSYSRAHARLTDLEDAFGPLVERQRGGSGGGGSELTDRAEELLARFDRLRAEFTGTAEVEETVLTGRVVGREGELATVETPAGRVRALAGDAAVPEADAVQVSVRADAVTLHDPADAPATDATSARNRFAGEVASVERGEAVARVVVDVDADAPLAALVTMDSVEKLALRPGVGVVASFKATATRATPE
ncbi:TOBE domain-containing protein [Halomicrococcus sp. SG-WS-1]|uniref:TOBE domain-containing protein n=1 Tax=Halomicrococcus sp. SG-WS-1 TaxID=3439057 RepID=UPI003F7935F8